MAQARSFSLGGSSRGGLLLAVILAAITGVLVFILLQGNDSGESVRSVTGGGETTVVTAKQDIAARAEITEDMVQLTKVPSGALLGGAFSDRTLVTGRIARIPIYKGEQLVQDKLASEQRDLGLTYIVPDGRRGVGVSVDKVVGYGGLVRPGDRVDIVAVVDVVYRDIGTDREVTETRSFMLAQNIEVLAVEQELENVVLKDGQQETDDDGTPVDQPDADPEGEVVTLSLTPLEAQNLLLVVDKESTNIRLAARAPGDDEILEIPDSNYLSLADPEFAQFLQEALRQPAR